jgi:hypothetical protein
MEVRVLLNLGAPSLLRAGVIRPYRTKTDPATIMARDHFAHLHKAGVQPSINERPRCSHGVGVTRALRNDVGYVWTRASANSGRRKGGNGPPTIESVRTRYTKEQS